MACISGILIFKILDAIYFIGEKNRFIEHFSIINSFFKNEFLSKLLNFKKIFLIKMQRAFVEGML
jgi:hypothetical protein